MKTNKKTAFQELFLGETQDIYWAENHLAKALKKMAKVATHKKLAEAFEEHLDATLMHVERLNKVFELLGEKPKAKKCLAMEGLLSEADEVIGETEKDPFVLDVALIICAQKVEHYEISAYGSLRTLAEVLGKKDVAELFQATLDEEKQTDEKLTEIAIGFINQDAFEEAATSSKSK